MVGRLARAALERGDLPVVLDLKGWTRETSDGLQEAAGSSDQALNAVLRASIADVTAARHAQLKDEAKVLLIADGLNEVSGDEVLRLIVQVLDDQVEYRP